jgi:hypothetical protein
MFNFQRNLRRHFGSSCILALWLFVAPAAFGKVHPSSTNPFQGFLFEHVSLGKLEASAFSKKTIHSDLHAKPSSKTKSPALIRSVALVRSLSRERSSQSIPVKLRGVVTSLSGYKNSFFLQDSTAGISVDRTDAADVRVGDLVEVTGSSSTGLFAPVVLASSVQVVGHSSPPVTRHVSFGDLFAGAQDSQWIEVEGVVHSAKFEDLFGHKIFSLKLDIGGGSLRVLLQDFRGFDTSRLVESTLLVRGVCSSSFNERRQFVGLAMFVPNRGDIGVVQEAPELFAETTIPVRDVLQFGQGRHRAKVTGISTDQLLDQALYLQDGADGIRIQSSSKELAEPGKRVEALGFPVMGDYSPILDDASFFVVGDAAPVKPFRVEAEDVIARGGPFSQVLHDQQLVQLQGTVVENRVQGTSRVLVMQLGDVIFEAHLPLSSSSPSGLRNLGTGSVLLLTGICDVQRSITT